jgi:predicted RNase H-like HicB family nuclease/predicted transcriptional regulator
MLRVYPAVITKAEGEDYGVVFPDLPGCVTTGETVSEAATMAIEALAGHVAAMIEAEESIPEPTPLDMPLPDWLTEAVEVVAARSDRLADAGMALLAAPPLSWATLQPWGASRLLVPVEIPSRSVRINISLDDALLARLDRVAAADNETRSGFIARAVRELLDARQRAGRDRDAVDALRSRDEGTVRRTAASGTTKPTRSEHALRFRNLDLSGAEDLKDEQRQEEQRRKERRKGARTD